MRKRNVLLLFFFCVYSFSYPFWAFAGDCPIFVRHALASCQQNEGSVTLDFYLSVENLGDSAIDNLTLSHVPLFMVTFDEIRLALGQVPGRGGKEVVLTVSTPMMLDKEEFLRQPLFWTGEYQDESGQFHDVPLNSLHDIFLIEGEGGAQ